MARAPRHVAVIGCGFTGTSAFFQLVDGYPVEGITLFEASGRFGPGYPYQPEECPDYLINNTTDSMCLIPSNRRAFLQWLRGRGGPDQAVDEKGHLPRATYGAFLTEVFEATRTTAAVKGIEVRLVPAEATGLREDADGRVHITWAEGEITADMAVLATGRCPGVDAYPHPPAGATARYFAEHVMSEELDSVPLDATVHVLGASLSAYDMVNRLYAPETGCRFERDGDGTLVFKGGANRRHTALCSRSGRLKAMQSRRPEETERRVFTAHGLRAAADVGALTLADVAALIRREAEAQGARIDWDEVVGPYDGCGDAAEVNRRAGDWLARAITAARDGGGANFLVDLFADAQVTVWDAFAARLLSVQAERDYRSRAETATLAYAAPCPLSTAERLLALHRAGRLRVVTGVRDVRLAADGSHYRIMHRFGEERAEVLVNTTGAVDRRVASPRQPALIQSLVESGLLSPYRRGGIEMDGAEVDMASFRAAGARNVYLANMLLWGPGFFTSSAFMMATVVERLLQAAFAAESLETAA